MFKLFDVQGFKRMIAVLALSGSIFFGACAIFKPTGEQVREQPSKAVYQGADEADDDSPNLGSTQKVPGE